MSKDAVKKVKKAEKVAEPAPSESSKKSKKVEPSTVAQPSSKRSKHADSDDEEEEAVVSVPAKKASKEVKEAKADKADKKEKKEKKSEKEPVSDNEEEEAKEEEVKKVKAPKSTGKRAAPAPAPAAADSDSDDDDDASNVKTSTGGKKKSRKQPKYAPDRNPFAVRPSDPAGMTEDIRRNCRAAAENCARGLCMNPGKIKSIEHDRTLTDLIKVALPDGAQRPLRDAVVALKWSELSHHLQTWAQNPARIPTLRDGTPVFTQGAAVTARKLVQQQSKARRAVFEETRRMIAKRDAKREAELIAKWEKKKMSMGLRLKKKNPDGTDAAPKEKKEKKDKKEKKEKKADADSSDAPKPVKSAAMSSGTTSVTGIVPSAVAERLHRAKQALDARSKLASFDD